MNSVREQSGATPAGLDDSATKKPTFESTESPPSEVEDEEEDMADPNSYFDITLPTIGHRHSKSSDSKDFDFRICLDSHPDLSASLDPKNLSTADELFHQGRILPLYLSQRLRLSKRITAPDAPIAFSYSLHPADVDVDVLLQPESSSSGCPNSNGSAADGSSHGSFVRAKNHSESQPIHHRMGFRWKLLGHRKRSSKVGATNCEENVCKSCGRGRVESENLSLPDRRVHGWISHSGGFPLPTTSDRTHGGSFYLPRHSGAAASESSRRNPSQNLFRAKEFWRRYLKPFISRTTSNSQRSGKEQSGRFGSLKLKLKGSRSRANTPLGSPTHSGILSAPGLAPEDVQGAIAYCKASSSS